MNKSEHLLALAEAQLLGFSMGRDGYAIEDVITQMGLDKKEWEEIQKQYGLDYLTEEDEEAIANFLNQQSNV